MPRGRTHPDASPGLADEAMHHGHAQPGALASRLGGKKRLEQARLNIFCHAHPVIADFQAQVIPGTQLPFRVGIVTIDNLFVDGNFQLAASASAISWQERRRSRWW